MKPGAGAGRRANRRIILNFSETMQARSEWSEIFFRVRKEKVTTHRIFSLIKRN